MTTLFALLFLAIGMAIIVNTIMQDRSALSGFPRSQEPGSRRGVYLPMLLGVAVTLCGGGILVMTSLE